MSDDREQWTDAELVARCRAGDETALERLAALYGPALSRCLAISRRRHAQVDPDVIEDAAQDVFCRLWQERDHMLEGFTRQAKSLEKYLSRLMWRQVDELLRQEQRRHRRERRAGAESDERRSGPGPEEEQAQEILSRLSKVERTLVEELRARTYSDRQQKPSEEALRQLVHRIRQKVEEMDASKPDHRPEDKK